MNQLVYLRGLLSGSSSGDATEEEAAAEEADEAGTALACVQLQRRALSESSDVQQAASLAQGQVDAVPAP